jgi:hypothetical protein
VICCPTGGRDTTHQIVNDSDAENAYLPTEVCKYPDSEDWDLGTFGFALLAFDDQ